MSDVKLRRIFADICLGYSEVFYGKKKIYIKHFSHFDQIETEEEKERYEEIAKKRKIPTEKEKLEWLESEGLWGKAEEKEVRNVQSYLDGLKKSRASAAIASQIRDWDKQIAETEAELDKKKIKKLHLIGLTAEKYAEQKAESSVIKTAFYKDKSLTERLFSDKAFASLDDEEVNELFLLYIRYIKDVSHDNIRKIAISDFFTNYFYLTNDSSDFFNKKKYELTFNQINLLKYGAYYKHILTHYPDIPEDVKNDPDKLEQWVNRSNNARNILSKNKTKNGRTAIIGATEKDDAAFIGGVKDDVLKHGEINSVWDATKSGKIKIT